MDGTDVSGQAPVRRATDLDDRYRLGALIGRGGMADVYRADDLLLDRPVAVKMLRELTDEVQRSRFVAEARTLAALEHPGLITVLDAGSHDDRPYLVMELAEGPTLASRIQRGPLAETRIASIGRQLAEALAYAHDLGVVHRDVKPSNVLLCAEDRVLLADFGIARIAGATEQHTRPGEAIGSPAYLAPEQVAGEPLTAAVDVFSLGLVLLEALTGRRAYTGSPVEAAIARLTASPEIPATLSAGWRDLLTRMTRRDPAGRPTAAEVAETLGGAGVASPPPTPAYDELEATGPMDLTAVLPTLTTPGRGRRPILLVSAAAAVVLAVVLGAWLALGGGRSPEPNRAEVPAVVPSDLQPVLPGPTLTPSPQQQASTGDDKPERADDDKAGDGKGDDDKGDKGRGKGNGRSG